MDRFLRHKLIFLRKFITILFLFAFTLNGCAQDVLKVLGDNTVVAPPTIKSFTIDTMPYASQDLLAPMRGANTFYSSTQWANIPNPATSTWSLDNYYRFHWALIQTGASTYDWTDFDNQVRTSITRKQRFEYRVVTLDTDAPSSYPLPSAGGARMEYPVFLHNQMQAESVKDWIDNGTWIPNWNSTSYLTAWRNFCRALNTHITTASVSGVPIKNVISKIDLSGFGNYSEWHSYPFINRYPLTAQKATSATLTEIIDISLQEYSTFCIMGNINMFVGEIPADVGYHAFFATNTWGRIGILNDHFGWTSTYNNDVPNNTRSFNGVVFGTQIQQQYKVAPIAGEPMNDNASVTTGGSCAFWHMETEIRTYHASQFNNQNGTGATGTCVNNNYLASSKACGYRLLIKNGDCTDNVAQGQPITLTTNWRNDGIAPVYENWDTQIELRSATTGATVWFALSAFKAKFFQPGATTIIDNFSLPVLPVGIYTVVVSMLDPTGYRNKMPLAHNNGLSDGSFSLTTVNIIAAP